MRFFEDEFFSYFSISEIFDFTISKYSPFVTISKLLDLKSFILSQINQKMMIKIQKNT